MRWKRFVQCCSVRNMVIMILLYISFTIFKKRYFVKQLASFTCFIKYTLADMPEDMINSICLFVCLLGHPSICVHFLFHMIPTCTYGDIFIKLGCNPLHSSLDLLAVYSCILIAPKKLCRPMAIFVC